MASGPASTAPSYLMHRDGSPPLSTLFLPRGKASEKYSSQPNWLSRGRVYARAKGEEKGAAFLSVCVNPAREWGVPVKTRGVDLRPCCGGNCIHAGRINQNVEQSKACSEAGLGRAGVLQLVHSQTGVSSSPSPKGLFIYRMSSPMAKGQITTGRTN